MENNNIETLLQWLDNNKTMLLEEDFEDIYIINGE